MPPKPLLLALSACGLVAAFSISGPVSRRFDGIGGLSGGGATSCLFKDYDPDVASGILDMLFKPDYLASLHMLKVEIGGDAQSTDGAESSHMHSADDTPNFNRGYEWWLLKEAKQRNPDILTYGLPWAWPGWIGDAKNNNPYENVTVAANYITSWVKGAKDEHDIDIDYVGIWNERGYTKSYIETLRATLDSNGFTNTKIVAHDQGWDIVTDILDDSKFADTIDAIGVHYPGSHSPANAEQTGKQMWASEDMSTYNDNRGAQCWAKILNQNFVTGNMTATISWNLIASYYHGLPWYGTALMTATEPWSGHWDDEHLGMMYATAHTTQFSAPGWHYLAIGGGSGTLTSGGSYVSLTDGEGQLTIVIEKMAWAHSQCIRPSVESFPTANETVTFDLGEEWASVDTLHVYKTQFGWDGLQQTTNTYFEDAGDITLGATRSFELLVTVDSLITITTLPRKTPPTLPSNAASKPFPVPLKDDFDSYATDSEAKYWMDQYGIWEIHPAAASSHGNVMRQMVPAPPISWSGDYAPQSVIGDTKWQDVDFTIDILIEESDGLAFVGGRCNRASNGVYAAISATGRYVVASNFKTVVTHGAGPSDEGWIGGGMADVSAGKWNTVRLVTKGNKATGYLNGFTMFSDATVDVTSGFVCIGTGTDGVNSWDHAQFDNFALASASALTCGAPKAGTIVTGRRCGSPNGANSEWGFDWSSGAISLKADPSLCLAADPTNKVAVVATCNTSDANQVWARTDSMDYPRSTLSANGMILGTPTPGSNVTLSTTGAATQPCDTSDAGQRFTLTSEGFLRNVDGLCVSSYCNDPSAGCHPVKFTECDVTNAYLLWNATDSHQLMSNKDGLCLDNWGYNGPAVGVYSCNGGANQKWTSNAQGQWVNGADGKCLSNHGSSDGNLMIDEFGNGELTPYGPFVTDYCIAACPM